MSVYVEMLVLGIAEIETARLLKVRWCGLCRTYTIDLVELLLPDGRLREICSECMDEIMEES